MLRNRMNPGAFCTFFAAFLPLFGMVCDGMTGFLREKTPFFPTVRLVWYAPFYPSDPSFCEETERWINNLMAKSVLLSGASARERFKFFQEKKNRINNLMEMAEG